MGLRFLEHVLILTPDPAATRDWFCDNIGLTEGQHPEFGFPVHWLYIGQQDVLHIGLAQHSQHQNTYLHAPTDKVNDDFTAGGALGSGRIDHICFNCEDLQGYLQRLTRNAVQYSERKAHNSGLYQLFMREPINGIKVELNFPAAEAQALGLMPAYTDTGSATH